MMMVMMLIGIVLLDTLNTCAAAAASCDQLLESGVPFTEQLPRFSLYLGRCAQLSHHGGFLWFLGRYHRGGVLARGHAGCEKECKGSVRAGAKWCTHCKSCIHVAYIYVCIPLLACQTLLSRNFPWGEGAQVPSRSGGPDCGPSSLRRRRRASPLSRHTYPPASPSIPVRFSVSHALPATLIPPRGSDGVDSNQGFGHRGVNCVKVVMAAYAYSAPASRGATMLAPLRKRRAAACTARPRPQRPAAATRTSRRPAARP